MAKEIERQVHDGELVEPEETSQGIPADGRGLGSDNDGTLDGFRAGRTK